MPGIIQIALTMIKCFPSNQLSVMSAVAAHKLARLEEKEKAGHFGMVAAWQLPI